MMMITTFIRHSKEKPKASSTRYKTTTKYTQITLLTCKVARAVMVMEGTNGNWGVDGREAGEGIDRNWLTEGMTTYVLQMR